MIKIISIVVVTIVIVAAVVWGVGHQKGSDIQISSSPSPSAQNSKLNVIVIDICSLRADHMSLFGYNRKTTPKIDAFASTAATFDNFWTQAGWCLPNFATMLTGTRPEKNGLDNDYKDQLKSLPVSIKTLGEIYQTAGYKTAAFSGAKFLSPKYGLNRGFDVFENKYHTDMDHPGSLDENLPAINQFLASSKDQNQPFFLYVTVDDIHSPYMVEDNFATDPELKDDIAKYKTVLPQGMELNLAFDRYYNGPVDSAFYQVPAVNDSAYKLAVDMFKKDPTSLPYVNARYDSAVKRADRLVGQLLEQVKQAGLYDNSIIVLTAHQGELLGEHGLLGHTQSLSEPILHVPLVVYMPGIVAGKRTQLSQRIDIPATLLDFSQLLNLNKTQFSGTSLLSIFKDQSTPSDKYIFSSSRPNNRNFVNDREYAVRDSQYKLRYYTYLKSSPYALYDLKNDPKETKDIYKDQPTKAAELKAELDKYISANK